MQTKLEVKTVNKSYTFNVDFTEEEVENLVLFAVYELIDRGAFIPQIPSDIRKEMEEDLRKEKGFSLEDTDQGDFYSA